MRPVSVELDDATHDTPKRRARDEGVEKMLQSIDRNRRLAPWNSI